MTIRFQCDGCDKMSSDPVVTDREKTPDLPLGWGVVRISGAENKATMSGFHLCSDCSIRWHREANPKMWPRPGVSYDIRSPSAKTLLARNGPFPFVADDKPVSDRADV